LRLRKLAAAAGGDLGGQAIEKAILTYRTTKSAPFFPEKLIKTHMGTIDDF